MIDLLPEWKMDPHSCSHWFPKLCPCSNQGGYHKGLLHELDHVYTVLWCLGWRR